MRSNLTLLLFWNLLLPLLLLILSLETTNGLSTSSGRTVQGRAVHKTLLNPSDATTFTPSPKEGDDDEPFPFVTLATSTIARPFAYSIASILDLDSSKDNFLATQVWPSARVAAQALLQYHPKTGTTTTIGQENHGVHDDSLPSSKYNLCEFGCGPGLPSLTAAHTQLYSQVVATDVDEFCLQLVQAAANDQGLGNLVRTQALDLTMDPYSFLKEGDFDSNTDTTQRQSYSWMKDVDLFVMADIFENSQVAKGAAAWTKFLLDDLHTQQCTAHFDDDEENGELETNDGTNGVKRSHQATEEPSLTMHRPRIWVFAQSDRAQREIYLESLRELCSQEIIGNLKWLPLDQCNENDALWLVDLEETQVQYG